MTLVDLMALTPVAPDVPFRFGTSDAMLRAYRAAIWHWELDDLPVAA